MARSVLFRADASPQLGIGHVMRCRTLAAELAGRGWTCLLACNHLTLETVPGLAEPPFAHVVEGTEPEDLTRALPPPDWLVIDHYRLDRDYETELAGWAGRILVIDDLADRAHLCDVLLDQTIGGQASRYAGLVPPGTLVLAGPRHALLRPQFREPAPPPSLAPPRLLISMGGTDPADATSVALEALGSSRLGLAATVVLGGRAPHLDKVRALAARLDPPAEVLVDVADMAAVMRRCQMAVGAAGTSALERMCLGLPTVTLVTADNQALVAEGVAQSGAGLVASLEVKALAEAIGQLASDHAGRAAMARAGRALCDGMGTARLATVMELRLRPATRGDGGILLEWRNDPQTRANSLDTGPVAPETHFSWLDRVLADPGRMLMMAERNDGEPEAMVRFDHLDDGAWRVSIGVAPQARGGGLGEAVLALGCARLEKMRGPAMLRAEVREDNAPSLAIFRACGFIAQGISDGIAVLERRP